MKVFPLEPRNAIVQVKQRKARSLVTVIVKDLAGIVDYSLSEALLGATTRGAPSIWGCTHRIEIRGVRLQCSATCGLLHADTEGVKGWCSILKL